MAARSNARVVLTLLMTFTLLVSVAAPVAALGGDDGGVSVGGDDPVGVSTDNGSVGVTASDDSVSVSDDGVKTDTDDTLDTDTGDTSTAGDTLDAGDTSTDGVQSGSTDTVTDGVAGTQSGDDEELPYNYSDIPFSLVPADLCRGPPDAPDAPVDPTDPPEPAPSPPAAPVDPTNPPSAPVTQCDVFNPYDPAFDPTDAPDDPSASYRVYRKEVGPDGAYILVGADGSPDSDYPGGGAVVGAQASQDGVAVGQYTSGTDGSRDYVVFTSASHEPGTKQGSARAATVVIGRAAGANIVCDGEACAFSQSAAPVGGRTVPTGGSDSGGSPLPEVPCEPPVGPDDAPEPPVDPTDPPEPIPSPPAVPVDPTNPPSAPLGPCDAYDPNDPPSTNPNPDYGYTVYQVNQNGVVVGGYGTYNRSGGPGDSTALGATRGDDGSVGAGQYSSMNDGQKRNLLFSDVRYTPGTKQGHLVVSSRVIGKSVGASIVCDGEACAFGQSAAPVGGRTVPTGGGDSGGSPLSPEPPAEIPCSAPVGPGDAPEPPVDPTDPPEPIPSPPSAPVDPTNPPELPLGPCDAYDPNDPPSLNPDPDYGYTVYQIDQNAVLVALSGTYNRTGGPGGTTVVGVANNDDRAGVGQYARGSDGQQPYMTFVSVGVNPDSLTRIGLTGYQLESDTVVSVRAFGKSTGASMVCDGEKCYISQSAAPVGGQSVRIATEDADESQSAAETTTEWGQDQTDASAPSVAADAPGASTDGTTGDSGSTSDTGDSTETSGSADTSSTDGTDSGGSSAGTATTSDAGGSAADAADSTAAAGGSTLSSSAPVGSADVADFPGALADGLPDAAGTAETLMELV